MSRTTVIELGEALCAAKCAALVRDLRLFDPTTVIDPRANVVRERLLSYAVELGLLKDGRRVPTAKLGAVKPYAELLVQQRAVLDEDPIGFAWLVRSLDALQPVLVGSLLAEEALFPRNDFSLASQLYSDSLVFSFFSKRAVELAKGPRVLEVGAGTGGTARELLKDAGVHEYVFTELSPLLLAQAQKSLVDPRLRFQVLDLDAREWDVGSGFDVALALNVLHLAQDVSAALAHLHSVLRPGGVLLLGEVSRPEPGKTFPFMDFTFGLLPSFHEKGRLLDVPTWHGLLAQAGFHEVTFWPLDRGEGSPVNFGGLSVARKDWL